MNSLLEKRLSMVGGWPGSFTSVSMAKLAAWVSGTLAAISVLLGCGALISNQMEMWLKPAFYALGAGLILLSSVSRGLPRKRIVLLILAGAALIAAITVPLLPEYFVGLDIHGIIHRSLFSGILMLALSLPALSYSMYYALGATPRGSDVARYPVFILPAVVALAAYALIIVFLIARGTTGLSWDLFTQPFASQLQIVETWVDGWPVFSYIPFQQPGMLNHIMGTFLLMGLTTFIALPIGIASGVFVTQYAGRRTAMLMNVATTALRAISGIVLLLAALNLLNVPAMGSALYYLFHGFGYDINGTLQAGRSSYLFASFFISLLVIPLIARSTQEGLNSLPADIQEGSLALGASQEYSLFHLQLPWAMPSIITGVLLGCAEAAGALVNIFLIAGTGEFGVSPTHETTSLAYLIFDSHFGRSLGSPVQGVMESYQYTAALVLLVITMGLTASALFLKSHFTKRYKSG